MNTATISAGRLTGPLLGIGGIGLVVSFGAAMVALMGQGHGAFNTTNDGVVWGLPVATYVYFVLSSTGLTFVASLAMVFGFKEFYPIAKRCIWLAVATLVAGFACLALELGHPFRLLWAVPFNMGQAYTSPLNWMGLFYSLYLVLLLLKFQKVQADDWDSGASRKLGIASFLAVIAAHGTIGMVFGAMAMRPFWYGGLIPLYFLASAFLSGVAFAVLITYVAYGFDQNSMPERVKALMNGALPKLFAATIALVGLFMIFRTITGLWSNADGLQVFGMMTKSPLFWFEVLVGMALPFYLMLNAGTRSQATMQIVSAVLVLVALFIGRYEFVIGGQLVPLFKGSWVPALVEYTPSVTEWMLTIMAISLTVTIYAVGEKMFNLSAEPK